MAAIDHIVIGAATLEQGADFVEALLGVRPGPGGIHAGAGTHNLLLGLGEGCYLEVIARDPAQPNPPLPRLFGLDDPARRRRLAARPGPIAWVARTEGLEALAARLGPASAGRVRRMARGTLSWILASPPEEAGFDGLLPTLIDWGAAGPPAGLPDSGCRLLAIEGEHPRADALSAALRDRGLEGVLRPRAAAAPRLVLRLRDAAGGEIEASAP
ncbi:VOC family protein [Roseomonas nepalensis]|uniref:VOC family protein n=1 Tax=Muricoccus nepalensis TaxID=1854500 RepID=A0A502G0Y1_9PROT|nr:VOC family protein [Roseomonas nepalensis]TPG55508.1 VOC family protein [Roseomonas nepalensis]